MGPTTAPAIQALLEEPESLLSGTSVGVAALVSPLSMELTALVGRALEAPECAVSLCKSLGDVDTDGMWSLRLQAVPGSRTN